MMNNHIWERLLSYQSTETIQQKLEKHYQLLQFEHASERSYENSYRFIYFLKHGENFFKQANQSPYAIQPILLFYGFSQLIKASLILKDPVYPSTATVLAHGVSSRKRKKQQYHFLKDEIKIQRNGLFPHVASKLFQINHLEAEKYSMETLLQQIAEMSEVFTFHHVKKSMIKLPQLGSSFQVTEELTNAYHLSTNRFIEYLSEKNHHLIETITNDTFTSNILTNIKCYECHPLSYHIEEDAYYLPASRDLLINLPELLAHYLLLYNLSMISRYETEWWYELLLGMTSDDYPFIIRYMEIVKRKIPLLIFHYLEGNL